MSRNVLYPGGYKRFFYLLTYLLSVLNFGVEVLGGSKDGSFCSTLVCLNPKESKNILVSVGTSKFPTNKLYYREVPEGDP